MASNRHNLKVVPDVPDTFENNARILWNKHVETHLNLMQIRSEKIVSLQKFRRSRAAHREAHAAFVMAIFERASISQVWLSSAEVSSDSSGSRIDIRYCDLDPRSPNHGHVSVLKTGEVIRHQTPHILQPKLQLIK